MSKKINISLPKEQRLGQIGINNQGEEMTIVAYRKYEDIDIQFEDKSIVKHKNYGHFLRGEVAHPIRYEESFAYHIEVELGLDINKIWNFEKNTVSPYEIKKQSNKKVLLYCQEKDYHNDNNGYKISCSHFYEGNRCSYCGTHKTHKLDSLGYLYPQIAKMIINDERNNVTMEDMYKIAPKSSSKKFYFKCDKCGESSATKKIINNVVLRGFSCDYCSDGISIPEKFMIGILKQLDIEFITQLNKSTFKWCQNYKYDFYIPSLSMIIETHGLQHYGKGFNTYGGKTLEEEQENDRLKKELALNNNIDNYIVIDCRYSEFDWLKENAIKELSSYFSLSNINWELIWKESKNSLLIKTKELIEKGYEINEISKILNIHTGTIYRYKKELGIKTMIEIKQENILKTKELIDKGYADEQIIEELKISKYTLYNYKKELGIKTRSEIKEENILKTKELIDKGYNDIQIIEELGVCRDTIVNYKKELGIETDRTVLKQENILKTKELIDKEYTDEQIIEELDIKWYTLYRYKKELGIKTMIEIKQENILKTKELIDKGYTDTQVAKELKISKYTLYSYKKELGIKTRSEIKEENILKTKELIDKGYTVKQIAEELGVCISAIYNYIKN